jgi:hypothetical protein
VCNVGRQYFKTFVRWLKNKKHWVGLSIGSLVLSIFRFSVLSQWFTFCSGSVVCLFTLGGNVFQLGKVAEIEVQNFYFAQKLHRRTTVEFSTKPSFCQTDVPVAQRAKNSGKI